MIREKKKSSSRRVVESSSRHDCPLCKSFGDFRKAIHCGSIDAATAKRIFNKHFVRLREICKRENCSMEMARTINAVLECDIDYAFRREGKPGFLKAYDSVETLLEDLLVYDKNENAFILQLIRTGSHQDLKIGEK